ncbi:right-handed parallel beta-helix repeat-containing protein [Amycolatopsis sp. NPDC058278]|uniref:right-handed parallel beta-helix repeat-containing protein n=1 Tax=Amycolatopsis sp. NPDC058278 TaxID=3346417 RepID=UPI0036DC745D
MRPFDDPRPGAKHPWRRRRALSAVVAAVAALSIASPPGASAAPVTSIWLSSRGNDANDGTAGKPVASLQKARDLVRRLNHDLRRDVVVNVGDGVYRLTEPLVLTAEDSGSNGHRVLWQAAKGAHPVVSGGERVTGWRLSDPAKGIWSAPVRPGSSTRQLYVDGVTAQRARTAVSRSDLTITPDGYTIADDRARWLLSLPGIDRAEFRGIDSFTDRYAPVERVAGGLIRMEQPSWRNNTWGWDHLGAPFHEGGFFVENALSLLDEPGEWFLDENAARLYYKPLAGQDVKAADVELPKLESLLQIGGSYDRPAQNISVSGLKFSDTTWRLPSSSLGLADQQTGTFIGDDVRYPEFEASRPHWHQMPAAVQVSAAHDIELIGNTYTDLGAVGIGIGNDANAHASGVGLGAQRVAVQDSVLTQIAGNGITVGGVQADAHHPSDPRMIVKDIDISDNLVTDVAKVYTSGVAILTTYTENAAIVHNEVGNLPYSGINTGFGWGANDAGGSPEYERRGLYKYQPKYATPTTSKNNRIAGNLVHDVMKMHTDGAAFYNLSANPGTVWERNHSYGNQFFAVYADEGSRYGTWRANVFDMPGNSRWFNGNFPGHLTGNLTITGNWTNSTDSNARDGDRGNVVKDNVLVSGSDWPVDAYRVIYEAGRLRNGARPTAGHLSVVTAPAAGGAVTLTARFTNVGTRPVTDLVLSATAEGRTMQQVQGARCSVSGGDTVQAVWRISAPVTPGALISSTPFAVTATYREAGQPRTLASSGTALSGKPVAAPWRGYGSVPAVFAEDGGRFAIAAAGADVWGAGGQHDDEYGVVYQPGAIDGDGRIVARVDRQDATNSWTKSGIVVRNDLTAAKSAQGYAAVLATPANGVVFAVDSDGDGMLDAQSQVPGVRAPVWLKLVRTGNQVEGFSSADGSTWTRIGPAAALRGAGQVLDAGLLHTSHDPGKPGLAEFGSVSITR